MVEVKLNPSKLGTKDYWDEFYELERKNFADNTNDTGESWFSDSDAENRVVQFLEDVAESGEWPITSCLDNVSFCDLGTGNGRLLFSIREAGFEGPMTGLDYSEPSVEFARAIAEHENVNNVTFEQADFLGDKKWETCGRKWDVVLDKGTLDAIALSDASYDGKTGVERYAEVVPNFIKDDGFFLITSCNFTEEELTEILGSGPLKVWKRIEYPTFEFGGVKGSTVCSLAFVKR